MQNCDCYDKQQNVCQITGEVCNRQTESAAAESAESTECPVKSVQTLINQIKPTERAVSSHRLKNLISRFA